MYSVCLADGQLPYAPQSPRRLPRAELARCQAVTSRSSRQRSTTDVGTGQHCVCCATYLRQAYAPYRYSASSPSHPHWPPWRGQAGPRRHRATGEEQDRRRLRHIAAAVGCTSGAEAAAAGRVGAAEGGGGKGTGAGPGTGSDAVEGRHWGSDWGLGWDWDWE